MLLPDGAVALFELYVRRRDEAGVAPKKPPLDFDSTDDPTHGDQEGSYYHGYYGRVSRSGSTRSEGTWTTWHGGEGR